MASAALQFPDDDRGVKRRPHYQKRPIEIIGDAVRIALTRGKFAWVDIADIAIAQQHNWAVRMVRTKAYAVRRDKDTGRIVTMHQYLLQPPDNMKVDHIDGNGLNNRRANIRVATPQQNRWNQTASCRNTSGAVGAHLDKRDGRYIARIIIRGVTHRLGKFDTAAEAGAAYAAAAERLHGDFAFTRGVGASSATGGVE